MSCMELPGKHEANEFQGSPHGIPVWRKITNMKKLLENNMLTIYLEGRIDSSNAAAVESELFEAVNANPEAAVTIDA